MDLKAPTWSLVLVILAGSFTAVSTSIKTKKVISSSSSSWSSGPVTITKGSQFQGGFQRLPSSKYTKTYKWSSSDAETKWSSNTLKTQTLHNITMHKTSSDRVTHDSSMSSVQTYRYVHPTQYNQIIPSHVIVSLQIANRFRYNAIFIFGFLLQSPNSRLTVQQYTSLKIIYRALQRREVQMYRLLTALAQTHGQSKTVQLTTLMYELTKYLPQYYSCAAGFWASQLHNKVFNVELIDEHEELDLFTGITENDIKIILSMKADDGMSGYDESSKLTEMLLGRVFVKIFNSIIANKLSLTQQLFAIILRNLPNLDGDVVFEEYVQLIAEFAWRNAIPNWEEKQIYQDSIDIYELIITMTQRITDDKSVSEVLKTAFIYVKNHFLEQGKYVMTAHKSYEVTGGGGLDITDLLSIISGGDFSSTSVEWKNRLLEFCRSHTVDIQIILTGMNRYGYISRQELLVAFLTRLRTRLPVEYIEIHRIVYSLLTVVERKILVWRVIQTSVSTDPSTTDLLITTTRPDQTDPFHVGVTPTIPGKTHSPHVGHISPAPGEIHSLHIGPTEFGRITPVPGEMHSPDIGPSATTPGKMHSPGEMHSPDIGPSATTPGKMHSPGEMHSPDIGPTATTPGKMHSPGEMHSPDTGPSATTPGKMHSPDIGPTATTPGKTHSPEDGPITSAPGEMHSPDTGPSATTPGKMHSPDIGPTATTPGITHSPDGHSSPSDPDTSTPHPDITSHPPEDVPKLPREINPNESIDIGVTDTDVPIFSLTVGKGIANKFLTVPSITCLQKSPNDKRSQSECETKTEKYITTHLKETLGKDYIPKILGSNWKENYRTKISFLTTLLEKAPNNSLINKQTELIATIKRYKIALKSAATYVFLPLITQYQKINTSIVWSAFDVTNSSKTYIGSDRPKQIGINTIIVPLVNPIGWLKTVDLKNPFTDLLPDLPADDHDFPELHRLYEIFSSDAIVTLMGKDWDPSVYPNRGALLISVLRTLLNRETIKTDNKLHHFIQNYLKSIELPSTYTHIPTAYLKKLLVNKFRMIIPRLPMKISNIKATIPDTINPKMKVQLILSKLDIPFIKSVTTSDDKLRVKDLVTLPSVACLQQAPSGGNSSDNCENDVSITEILIQTFGTNYIQLVLGSNATAIYPTKGSLLVALLEKVQTSPELVNKVESLQKIRRYESALKSVASYVLLPLIMTYRTIDNAIVWLSYNINNRSQTDIKPSPPRTISDKIISVPLVNPKTWILSVDILEPLAGFIPKFSDEADAFAIMIQPLTELIETGSIYKLLGPNWKPSEFPNRGALYMSVIYTLLTVEEVKANPKLYALLRHYKTAIEQCSIHGGISTNYFNTLIDRWQIDQEQIITRFDPTVANVTARDDILFPALIDPKDDLRVTIKSLNRTYVQTSQGLGTGEIQPIILPSVNCLQAFPLDEDDNYCEHFPDIPVLHSIMKTLGTKESDELTMQNDDEGYPTVAGYLKNFFTKAVENRKIAEQPKLVADIKTYMWALEFASAYIFIPLLTNYQDIYAELVWLTYDTTDHLQCHMSRHRADNEANDNIISLPLVNPKVWLQPVNIEHPFSSFIPQLPADDPYATKLQPLVHLFNSGEVQLLLGSNFSPANYPNRGSLLISALRALLESKTVQSIEPLHKLVEDYFNVIQVVSLYVNIPQSWINNGFTKAQHTWVVDTADLSTALPFPQTMEERQYYGIMQVFLQRQDILLMFDIRLPSSITYKAEFLIMIIKKVLRSSGYVQLDRELQIALEYYSAKAEFSLVAKGGVVRWVWVPQTKGTVRSTNTMRLDIGKIFVITIPLNRLKDNEAKVSYFKLIKFMNDNPDFLKTDDFKYERYHNFGQFLRAYLNHLSRRPNIDENIRRYIRTVAHYIRNTGPGAQSIRPKKTNKQNH